MKRFCIIFALIILSVFYAFAGGASETAEKGTITVATDATWPPMEFLNEDKELIGFDIDLMTEIGARAGLKIKFQNTAWDGIFAGLVNGDYDAIISSVTVTDERKKTIDFSDTYINAGQVLIVAATEADSIQTLDDLNGRSVGAQLGTTGALEIEKYPEIDLRTYDELGFAIEDLANGQIDGIVADTPIAANYVLQNETYKDTLKIVGTPFTEEYYAIGVQKGNSELLTMLNDALASIKADGTIDELKNKWLQ